MSDSERRAAYERELCRRIEAVYRAYPELPDCRREYPWLTGCLGDPFADVWFVAENPSLGQVEKAAEATPESQWSISKGDQLFRQMLVKHGFKEGPEKAPGGWRCYITDVVKSAHRAEDWNRRPIGYRRGVAESWADVLRWELGLRRGTPRLVVSVGRKVDALLDHLVKKRLIEEPQKRWLIDHYSYIAMRPDRQRQLPPLDMARVDEYDEQFANVARILRELRSG